MYRAEPSLSFIKNYGSEAFKTAQQVAKETAQNKIDELAKQLGAVVNTDEPDDLDVSDGDGLNDSSSYESTS